jgi:predicted transcriptional regulator
MYSNMLYAYAMSKARPVRVSVSVRLTPQALQILKELAQQLGVSQAAVIEIALRKFEKENKENDD